MNCHSLNLKSSLPARVSALAGLFICLLALPAQAKATQEQMKFWITDPHTGESVQAVIEVPDKSLWNTKRITDYQDSLYVNAEPPIGVLMIDDVDIEIPIYNGADDLNLNRGVGRIKGMARLNEETGNLGIAGHRDGIFRGLKDIQVGDEIEVQTPEGLETYAVSSITIVPKADISVLSPTEDKTLTLVTCYPFYHVGHAPKRFIVKATHAPPQP